MSLPTAPRDQHEATTLPSEEQAPPRPAAPFRPPEATEGRLSTGRRRPGPAPTADGALARSKAPLVVALLAVGAAAWASLGSLWVFPIGTSDNDEAVYQLQAEALASGHLFPPAPEHHRSFRPWFTVHEDGRYVLKYTPVHAAVLAAAEALTGTQRTALGLLAAAAVVLTYQLGLEVLGGDRRKAALVAVFLALSPLFVVQSATFLSYVGQLVLLEGGAVALLRGVRRDRRPPLALAGLLLGLAFFARAFDAVVVSAPLVLWVAWRWWKRRDRTAVAWVALGAALPLGAMLAFNAAATGSFLHLPFSLFDDQDTLGYGVRRLSAFDAAHRFGFAEGWEGVGSHLAALAVWCGGGVVAVGLAVATAVRRRLRQWWPLGLFVTVPVAYSFFWGPYNASVLWGGSRLLGPFYFLPLLVPLALLSAAGFADLWARRRRWAVAAAAAMAGVTGFVLVTSVAANLLRTERDLRVHAPIAQARRPAIVFMPDAIGPFVVHPYGFARNPSDYDGPVTYAVDLGNANFDALAEFPGRVPYALRPLPGGDGRPSTAALEALQVRRGPRLRVQATATNLTYSRYVVLDVTLAGRRTTYLLDTDSRRDRSYAVALRLEGGQAVAEGLPVLRTTRVVQAEGALVVRLRSGGGPEGPLHVRWARRLPYRPAPGGGAEILVPTARLGGTRPEPLMLTSLTP